MSPGDRARPIMEYVYELENQVRLARSLDRRFNRKAFLLGAAAGLATGLVCSWLLFYARLLLL